MIGAEVLRAWWAARQGLDGRDRNAEPAEVLASAGWARSIGGAGPYLSIHSRARTPRVDIDASVAALAVHELPSARGCTYVVPAEHFALALTLSRGTVGELATVARLGVPDGEVEVLADTIVDVLGDEQLDPAGLRARLGDQVRHLGKEGKKRGATTTLPAALGLLQTEGRIRRVPVDGRLDQQRYRYVRWDQGPLADGGPTIKEARAELARLFFLWTGPATVGQFRSFSGLTAKAAKDAIAELDLVGVNGPAEGLLALAEFAKELEGFVPPSEAQIELVASIDSVALLRRDAASLIDDADRHHPLLAEAAGAGASLADLPHHAIVDRGRVIGLWDFDPEGGDIVWATFAEPSAPVRAVVAETESYVRDELGDARSFSLDSPASRRSRLSALAAFAR